MDARPHEGERAARQAVEDGLQQEELQQRQQIRALFDEFDHDKKGRLTLHQFEEGLKRECLWHRIRDDVRLRPPP